MEVRLIDANEMAVIESEAYLSSQVKGKMSLATQAVNSVVHQKIQMLIADTPTIDPETLPIVQELRGKVSRLEEARENANEACSKWERKCGELEKQLAEVTLRREILRTFYNDIVSKPDCNTCKNKNCEYRPKLGDLTRFNCPLWEGEE